MPYNITDSSGDSYTISDGTINTNLDISLIGKGYANYGSALNQNLLRMLEHFASATQPTSPVVGQLWYDTSVNGLKSFNGATFDLVGRTQFGTLNAAILQAGIIGNSGATLTGTLSTASQPSITRVGTLANLQVSGAIVAGSLQATTVTATTIGNAASTLLGRVTTASQPSITSLGALTSLTVSGGVSLSTATVSGILYVGGTMQGSVLGSVTGSIGATTPSTGAFTTLTASSITGPITGSIGATSPSTGAFTTLTATGITATSVTGPVTGSIGATSPSTGAFTTLTASSITGLITGSVTGPVTGPVNGSIGATTPNSGVFTTVVSPSGAFGTLTATTVTASTIGNNASSIQGTIFTPAQPAITSVGTLNSLAVQGPSFLGGDSVRLAMFANSGATAVTLDVADYSGAIKRNLLIAPTGGSVGIGTTSPGYLLDVAGDIRSTGTVRIGNSGGTAVWDGSNLALTSPGMFGIAATGNVNVQSRTNFRNGIANDGGTTLQVFGGSAGITQFPNGPVQAASFGCKAGTGTSVWQANNFNLAWTGSRVYVYIDSTNLGYISTYSDHRVKKNITTMTSGALQKILTLRPVTYNVKDIGLWKDDRKGHTGFIAHEVSEVIPSAVEGPKDAVDDDGNIMPQSVDVMAIVATLTKAVQELSVQVDDLRAQLARK